MPLQLPISERPSPNHGLRKSHPVDILLLHYTGMRSAEAALSWLCDPDSSVSSHYFVFEDGRVVRLVDEARRAHHAGVSCWAGETDINSCSVGIEIANPGHEFGYRPFPDAQIDAVIALSLDILGRHAIPPERVLAHSDVAPSRKQDPGELFPWQRLNAAGVGHYAPPAPVVEAKSVPLGATELAHFKDRLRQYGYCFESDGELRWAVTAFQRHFRPERVDGVADRSTNATLDRLLGALGR